MKKWFYLINNKVSLYRPPLKFAAEGDNKIFNQENG